MFCESYRRTLTDVAASGEALPRELEAHLAGCAACSSAFSAEQALYASISQSLNEAVRVDAPASLVPRVREAIPEGALSPRRFSKWAIFIPATAAILLFAAFLVTSRFISRKTSESVQPVVSSVSDPPREPVETVMATQPRNSSNRVSLPKWPERASRKPHRVAEPEGQVEPGAQLAIARVILLAQEQPDTAQDMLARTEAGPIEIKPIELASIAWRPLSDETDTKSQFEPRR